MTRGPKTRVMGYFFLLSATVLAPATLLCPPVACRQAPPAPAAEQSAPPPAQSNGGIAASGPTFRVVRSVSGSKGETSGSKYVVEDPRSIFYLPQDKQIVVYFEWEGPTGPHDFEGYWKNPEGKISVISEFKYTATERRFGGYWTLTLNDTMETGLWTLEAHVDGEVTGTHAFQVLKAAAPAETPPAPRPLSAAEIYKKAGQASVFIDRMNDKGERAGRGSGFFLGDNTVITAFQVIDGASEIRVILPNGQTIECNTVLGWNRHQDWAVLEVTAPGVPHLERATGSPPAVGDATFLLDSPRIGGRTLAATDIVGTQEYPEAGKRLSISYGPSPAAIGGALLDEYGKVVGLLGGSLLPGASTLEGLRFGYSASLLKLGGVLQGALGVPIELVKLSPPRRASLVDLAKAGQLIPLVTENDWVLTGQLCKTVERKSSLLRAVDESSEFHRSDNEIHAVVTFEGKGKLKSNTMLEVFDLENRGLFRTEPNKLKLEPGQIVSVDWKLRVSGLAPGIYRVDVTLDGETAWRTFLKISE